MKKLLILIVILLFLSGCGNIENKITKKVSKYDTPHPDVIEVLYQNNEIYYRDLEIYGNYNDFKKDDLKEILSNKDKTYIFYDLDITDNLGNLEILKNHVVIYYFINDIPYISTLYSETTNIKELTLEIVKFINKTLIEINNNKTNMISLSNSTNNDLFSTLYSGSFEYVKKPYGYITCTYNVKKYRANDVSSLYLIESRMEFTPGSVAISNNNTGYENWKIDYGYVHLKALTAEDDMGYNQIRYGGTPVYKDSYPVNTPGQITISSSYSAGINLGYSFTNGFSLDNFTIEENTNFGLNINYSYSKSYTNTEPRLSTQHSPGNFNTYEWTYFYDTPKNETFNLTFGYLFEMNNSNHQLQEGDLAFRYDYKMQVATKPLSTYVRESFTWWRYYGYY